MFNGPALTMILPRLHLKVSRLKKAFSRTRTLSVFKETSRKTKMIHWRCVQNNQSKILLDADYNPSIPVTKKTSSQHQYVITPWRGRVGCSVHLRTKTPHHATKTTTTLTSSPLPASCTLVVAEGRWRLALFTQFSPAFACLVPLAGNACTCGEGIHEAPACD